MAIEQWTGLGPRSFLPSFPCLSLSLSHRPPIPSKSGRLLKSGSARRSSSGRGWALGPPSLLRSAALPSILGDLLAVPDCSTPAALPRALHAVPFQMRRGFSANPPHSSPFCLLLFLFLFIFLFLDSCTPHKRTSLGTRRTIGAHLARTCRLWLGLGDSGWEAMRLVGGLLTLART